MSDSCKPLIQSASMSHHFLDYSQSVTAISKLLHNARDVGPAGCKDNGEQQALALQAFNRTRQHSDVAF